MNYRCYKCEHMSKYPGGHPCGICLAGHDQFEWSRLHKMTKDIAESARKNEVERMNKSIKFKVDSLSVDQNRFGADLSCYPKIEVEMHIEGIDYAGLTKKGSGPALYAEIENRLNHPSYSIPAIKNVIFNEPATIVFWADGTKTVVKCQEGDIFDPEKGLTMAIAKKALGNKGNYCNEIKKWCEPWYDNNEETVVRVKVEDDDIIKGLREAVARSVAAFIPKYHDIEEESDGK